MLNYFTNACRSQSNTDDDEERGVVETESVVEEDLSQDDSDTNKTEGHVKAYDVLMRSLRENHHEKEPKRKKRRLDAAIPTETHGAGEEPYTATRPAPAEEPNGKSQQNAAEDVDAPDPAEAQDTSADEDEDADDEEAGAWEAIRPASR